MSVEPDREDVDREDVDMESWRCPTCNSTTTRYRKESNTHICSRCGAVWGEGRPEGGSRGWGCWAVGGVIFAVFAAVGLVSSALGGSDGAMIVAWIVVIGSIVGFFVWRSRRSKTGSSESEGSSESASAQFHPNPFCNEPVLANEIHCTKCGGEVVSTTETVDDLETSEVVEEETILCDICQTTVVLGQKFCGNCGSKAK